MSSGHGGPVDVGVSTKLSRRTLTSGTHSGALKREIEDLEKENIRAKEMIAGRDMTIARLGFENVDDRAGSAP